MGVVGSRDQLCINEELKQMTNDDKTLHCSALVNGRECEYYKNVDSSLREIPLELSPILDIEDLVRIGKEHTSCPYYMSKEIVKDANIFFMPYNYLLDPKIRYHNKIELENSIVVFDEAHNVEKMCEDSACTSITSTKIDIAISDLEYVSFCYLDIYKMY